MTFLKHLLSTVPHSILYEGGVAFGCSLLLLILARNEAKQPESP